MRRKRRKRRRRSRKWRRLRRRRGGGASLDCEYCNRRAYCSTREGDTHTDSEREREIRKRTHKQTADSGRRVRFGQGESAAASAAKQTKRKEPSGSFQTAAGG